MDEQLPPENQPDTQLAPAETAESGACGRCKRSEGPKRAFLVAYGEYGIVSVACRIAGVGRSSFYEWRKSDPDFAAACESARQDAVDSLVAEARRRAVEGVTEEHVGKDGQTLTVRKYSDTLLIFLLKAADPSTFRDNPKTVVNNITNPSLLEEQERAVKALSGGGMIPAREHAIQMLRDRERIREAFADLIQPAKETGGNGQHTVDVDRGNGSGNG